MDISAFRFRTPCTAEGVCFGAVRAEGRPIVDVVSNDGMAEIASENGALTCGPDCTSRAPSCCIKSHGAEGGPGIAWLGARPLEARSRSLCAEVRTPDILCPFSYSKHILRASCILVTEAVYSCPCTYVTAKPQRAIHKTKREEREACLRVEIVQVHM